MVEELSVAYTYAIMANEFEFLVILQILSSPKAVYWMGSGLTDAPVWACFQVVAGNCNLGNPLGMEHWRRWQSLLASLPPSSVCLSLALSLSLSLSLSSSLLYMFMWWYSVICLLIFNSYFGYFFRNTIFSYALSDDGLKSCLFFCR